MFSKIIFGLVYIPDGKLGIVNKKFAFGKQLKPGEIIALNGEAGIQAKTLTFGLKWGYWFWKYSVNKIPITVVSEGKFMQVIAKAGKPLNLGRNLGNIVACDNFQDAKAFLEGNGQRGRQLAVLPAGDYRINTQLFDLSDEIPLKEVKAGYCGIVTVQEGKPITDGEIAKPNNGGHLHYQDPQKFIDDGGFKGTQIDVLMPSTYMINPWFADVQVIKQTEVPVGHAGVVISYVGDAETSEGSNKEGVNAKIVGKGKKGVCETPLETGLYPINTSVQNVVMVPITQVALYWSEDKHHAHELDNELSTIDLRTKDGFNVPMDVVVIIHIPISNAPLIVANYGSVEGLISQVLQSTTSSYFRGSCQQFDAMDLYEKRQTIQAEALTYIAGVLEKHHVECKDVLIDDLVLPETLTLPLTQRQIATQNQKTIEVEIKMQNTRKDLKSTEAIADIQGDVVKAAQSVSINENLAKAAVMKAGGERDALKAEADGIAYKTETEGTATAKSKLAIGTSEAAVIQLKVNSMGSGYVQVEVAKQLMSGNKALVPATLIMSGSGKDGSNPITDLLTMKLVKEVIDESKDVVVQKKEIPATVVETPAPEEKKSEGTNTPPQE